MDMEKIDESAWWQLCLDWSENEGGGGFDTPFDVRGSMFEVENSGGSR